MPRPLPPLYEKLVQKLEKAVREGRGGLVAKTLQKALRAKIPREARLPLAALARRTHNPSLSLRLLNPVVRPQGERSPRATDGERAEYAAALIKLGADVEATAVLESIHPNTAPEALLYRAFAHVARWEYDRSVPLLQQYVRTAASSYQQTVGKVNLLAAFLYEDRFDEVAPLIDEILLTSERENFTLLQSYTLRFAAQYAVCTHQWPLAETYLRELRERVRDMSRLDQLLFFKWEVLLLASRFGPTETSLARLSELRARAEALSHWETIRDVDRFQAVLTSDEALFLRVHFGTPFASFRKKLRHEMKYDKALPGRYVWRLQGPEDAPIALDLSDTRELRRRELKPQQLIHRLLQVLSTDFYRSFPMGNLYSQLYPERALQSHPFSGQNPRAGQARAELAEGRLHCPRHRS
jgi:hypothetical protein